MTATRAERQTVYFEEFQVGQEYETAGRTVTETDIVLFAGLTGAYNPIFLDAEYGKRTMFKSRITPGILTAGIATGLTYQHPAGVFREGFIALSKLAATAKAPVLPGDTIQCRVRVAQTAPVKDDRGRVLLQTTVLNQRKEDVLDMQTEIVVYRRGKAPAG